MGPIVAAETFPERAARITANEERRIIAMKGCKQRKPKETTRELESLLMNYFDFEAFYNAGRQHLGNITSGQENERETTTPI